MRRSENTGAAQNRILRNNNISREIRCFTCRWSGRDRQIHCNRIYLSLSSSLIYWLRDWNHTWVGTGVCYVLFVLHLLSLRRPVYDLVFSVSHLRFWKDKIGTLSVKLIDANSNFLKSSPALHCFRFEVLLIVETQMIHEVTDIPQTFDSKRVNKSVCGLLYHTADVMWRTLSAV